MLADRVEGNLLAAQQEIERIALLRAGRDSSMPRQSRELVADSARYDVFELVGRGDRRQRVARVAHPRRPEGEGRRAAAHLWALVNDLRARVAASLHDSRQRALARRRDAQREQVWSNRQVTVQRRACAACDAGPHPSRCSLAAARADRVAKGSLRGDAWVEIEGLVARIAGVPLAA